MNRPTVPNSVWITALVLWLLPGGIFLSLAYLFYQEIKFDKEASAWSKASFAEFCEREQKQKEAERDIHPISNQFILRRRGLLGDGVGHIGQAE